MKKRFYVRWKSVISVMLCMVLLLVLIPASPVLAEAGVVPDGIYLMENVYVRDNCSVYGTFYLQATSSDTSATFSVRTDETGDLEDNLYRYWYFEHLGNNEYVIRCMAKQSMVLTVNAAGDGVVLSEEGASLTSSSIWQISGSIGACTIKSSRYPTKSLMCPPNNASYQNNYYYLPARVSTYQGMTIDYWKLTACNDLKSKGIDDNTQYLIMNYANKRYMSLSQASIANGTGIKTAAYDSTSLTMRWKPIAQKDLSYQLICMYGGSKVLSASGTSLCLNTDTNAATQMFRIERIDSGTYQWLYYIRYGDYYVTASAMPTSSVYLSTTPTQYSAWSFKKVAKSSAHLYNFNYTYTEEENILTFDSTANQQSFVNVFNGLGYASASYTNNDTEAAMNSLRSNDIFVYRGHAGPGRLAFKTTEDVITGRIYAHKENDPENGLPNYFVSDLEDNSLSSLRCVLLLGCSSGLDNARGHNLMEALYEKGAHFVLGTTQTTYPDDSDKFLEGFIAKLNEGGNIDECVEQGLISAGNAVKYENNTTGSYPIIYIGDITQYLD